LPTGPAYQTLWLVVILSNGVILGFTLPLHFSLMAFSDDYGEWKTGVRSSGMNFAFNLFFIKLAWASSAGIISLVFIYVAYQPGAETRRLIVAGHHRNGDPAARPVPPAAGLSIRVCKLNNPMMARIATDLRSVTFSLKESVMSVMEVDLHKLKISDPFLGQYQQLVRDVVIPYQWDALNDRIDEADPSHAIENFRIAAGLQEASFTAWSFRTATWRNGWKPWPGRCARSRTPGWKKPPMR
jgi:hypothetical protein